MRNLYFAVLALSLLLVLSGALLRYTSRARDRSSPDAIWEEMLERLSGTDRNAIATIALDVVDEQGQPRHDSGGFLLEPGDIWNLLGGMEGLEALEKNCRTLVDLAAYLQMWYPEALVVAEELRLNAREIEWHVGRLKGAAETGNLQSCFADYAQQAVLTYYRMTRHLLALYDHAGFARLAELQRAI